ncbi:TolC family outer membrane protein [Rickettsiella endosymbiont of Miltochrista miniata]|uniref:TolC family outer membrane protein n=1 Tax=Rickettsiella endosymbiont of Miltochrista miniata TaxID=3066239 RepID=UPI00313F165B
MTLLDFFIYKSARRLTIYSRLVLVVNLCFAPLTPTFAADLIDIYKAALNSDPAYQAAVSTRLSQREAIPQSVAALLPNISAQANVSNNYQNITQPPTAGQPNGISNLQSQGYNISVRQPLININAWLAVKQANNAGKQADLSLAAAAQDLIFRVATAYFNVLSAQDTLRLAQAEKAADSKQLNQAQKRVQVGLDALTSVYEAKAAYDKSLATEISAENTLRNNQEALRQLTGQTYSSIKAFTKKIPLQSPQPENIEAWINAATRNNLKLMAARYGVEVTREKIKMQASGHLPSLSLIGNYGKTATFNNVPSSLNKNGGTLGLQLDIPLFAGGSVSSKTRQAQYDFQTASANLDNTYRLLIINTRQKYNDVLADISKIKAEQQAIKSAQLSLDSTEESYKAGTRTVVDVLIAQQNLYDAKRATASDQYNYLLDTLLLKQAAGSLKPDDLVQINQLL